MSDACGEADRRFMRQALPLAERGRGATRPNPVVGAVVVKTATSWPAAFTVARGLPHAEIEALTKVGMRAPGATLYVTLEPCCHQGRTGPCTEAIIASGISRVVVGCRDENPLVSGRGMAILRKAGVHVDAGCLEDECRRPTARSSGGSENKRPWVTMKAAATLDGFIGDRREKLRRGASRWITGLEARTAAHQLRAEHDAVLVGVGTVHADNPRLSAVQPREDGSPSLARRARQPTAHATRRRAAGRGRRAAAADRGRDARPAGSPARDSPAPLEAAGAEIAFVPSDRHGHVALPPLLRLLARREVQSLLVEGGSRVHGAFVASGLVDSVALFLAPRLVGAGVPIVTGRGLDWRKPATLGPLSVRGLGDDLLLTADIVSRGQRGGRRENHPPHRTVFTGIVEAIGKVESLRRRSGDTRHLTVKTDLEVGKLPLGASIAVNGACLTIVARRTGHPSVFEADVGPETLACTTLGPLAAGGRVHLEPALRLGDPMGGHMVSGHVDGTGRVECASKQASTLALRVRAPDEVAPYLSAKARSPSTASA